MSERIFFIDLGTKAGWAFKDPDGGVDSGVEDFSAFVKNRRLLYQHFSKWLAKMALHIGKDFPSDRPGDPQTISPYFNTIVCEKTFHSRFLFTLRKRVERFCKLYGIKFKTVDNKTLKKFWTGHGRADKWEMMQECCERGFRPQDHNEADAIAGLHWAMENVG